MISMLIDEDSIVEQSLFTWLREQYFADNTTRDAARRALGELLVFYILVLIGFSALWLTWKSNAKIRQVREEMKTVLREQKQAKFDPDSAKMYGMY